MLTCFQQIFPDNLTYKSSFLCKAKCMRMQYEAVQYYLIFHRIKICIRIVAGIFLLQHFQIHQITNEKLFRYLTSLTIQRMFITKYNVSGK